MDQSSSPNGSQERQLNWCVALGIFVAMLTVFDLGHGSNRAAKAEPAKKLIQPTDGSHTKSVDPQMGVYRWVVATDNVDAFGDWLGRDPLWGVDFIGSESWDNVEWPTYWLEAWSKWVHARPGRRFILSVPLLPGPVDGSGPVQGMKDLHVPVSLAKGAAGDYNHHFEQLARNLVDYKLENTILRLGWEFNGSWYTWKAKEDPKLFAEYWRQIVKTMRSVPGGENLRFCWNPTLGDQDFPADQAWPGDDYVDYVGLDVYDDCWNPDTYPWPKEASAEVIAARQQKVWDEWIWNSPRGLRFWTQFAADHHKPLVIPEWGLNERDDGHGGGDNPIFIQKMHDFVTNRDNNVYFHCYFDVNVPDEGHYHQLSAGKHISGNPDTTHFPKSAALFHQLFAKPTTPSTP